jgi:aspartate/methionine/tyrosine aminotransferase
MNEFKKSIDEYKLSYTSWSGLSELKDSVSNKLARENGYNADPNSEILITTGAQSAVMAIFMALLDQDDEIIIPAPFYNTYEEIAFSCGGKVIPIITEYTSNYTVNIAQIKKAISNKTKAIVLVSPSNPTGTVLNKKLIKEIYDLVVENNLILITDEIYEHYIFDDNSHYSIHTDYQSKENVISIYSLSKGYGLTGLRVGYIVSNKDLIAAIAPFHHAMSICAPVNSQYASIAALNLGRDWFNTILEDVNKRKETWKTVLDELNIPYGQPQGAYYICFDISKYEMKSSQIAAKLRKEQKIIINSVDDRYLRGSFMQDPETLQDGLNKLKKFFNNL